MPDPQSPNAPADQPPESAGPEPLGPFDPPHDFEFPAMLASPPPRPKPPAFALSRHERSGHRTVSTLLILAAACVALSVAPFVRTIGFYLLPLKILDWIGYGLGALALVIWIRRRLVNVPYAFIRDGTPTPARVFRIEKQTIGSGQQMQFYFGVEAEYVDPSTGEMRTQVFPSRLLGTDHNAFRVNLSRGDYTTVVVRPSGTPGAGLWGLLDADPDHDLLLKNGVNQPVTGVFRSAIVALGVVAALCLVLAAFYSFQFFMPIEGRALPLIAFLGGGFVVACAAMLWLTRKSNAPGSMGKRIVKTIFVGAFVGCGAGGIAMIGLNALLDRSPPAYADIEITEVWQTTYKFIFRRYEFEYLPLGRSENNRYPATVGTIADFEDTRAGVMELRSGAFGMPWIAALHPCVVVPVEPNSPRPKHMIKLSINPQGAPPDTKFEVELGIMISLPDGSLREPSDRLAQRALAHLKTTTH
jgi:hypothetical protein